jgi:hypothetical protein
MIPGWGMFARIFAQLSKPSTPATAIRVGERSRRTFGVPDRTENAALQTVECAFGRKEAKTASVPGDDAGGAILDFDDIGVGHDCSFAATRRSHLISMQGRD